MMLLTGKYCFYGSDVSHRKYSDSGNAVYRQKRVKVYGVLICGLVLLAAGIVFQRHKSI